MFKSPSKSCKKNRSRKKNPGWYAVMPGRKNGIFLHWTDACKSTEGVHGNRHKGCENIEEAEALLIQDSNTNS
jgi:viroplasmin and RNaseH domain-containing protein